LFRLSKKQKRRGFSTLLLAVVLTAVIIVILVPLSMNILEYEEKINTYKRSLADYTYQASQEKVRMRFDEDTGKIIITVENIGGYPISIDKIFIECPSDYLYINVANLTEYPGIELVPSSAYDGNTIMIDVGKEISLRINRSDYELWCSLQDLDVQMISKRGVIHEPLGITYVQRANISEMLIAGYVPLLYKDIYDLAQDFGINNTVINEPYPPLKNVTGMVSEQLLFIPTGWPEYDVDIYTLTNNEITFGVLAIGYDPSWVKEIYQVGFENAPPPRYFIFIAGGEGRGPTQSIKVGTKTQVLDQQGWRLKIYNFTGDIIIYQNGLEIARLEPGINGNKSAMGFWYYGYSVDLTVYINGHASKVVAYQRSPAGNIPPGSDTSYEPYLLLGDFDGNFINELVYVTEDATYDGPGDVDDHGARRTSVELWDQSTTPLILIIPGSQASSDEYGAVQIKFSYYVHDNSWDPYQLNDNYDTRDIITVALVDASTGEIVVSKTIGYQEITFLHQTVIDDFSEGNKYFTRIFTSLTLPIPNVSGKIYYAIIMIEDPYGNENGYNDADFTIGIEVIDVQLYSSD
jgi:hypothetical protein